MHIIFTYYTSILFAHSNLIDFNKYIHKYLVILNKWFNLNKLFQVHGSVHRQ